MSNSNFNTKTSARAPLFLVLLGALSFTLSGHKSQPTVESVTLSSEVANIEQQLDQNGTANSEVTTRDGLYTGSISIQRKKVYGGDEALIISGDVHCKGDDNCDPSIKEQIYAHVPATSSLKAVVDRVSTEFAAAANSLKQQAAADKAAKKREQAKQEREEACLDKPDGQERVSCRADKFAGMDDEKKASSYFEKYLRGDLENLLGSDNRLDQQRGVTLLRQLQKNDTGGKFVKEELNDIAQYGGFKIQASQLKSQIVGLNAQMLAMPMGDPRRQALGNQINMLSAQGRAYQTYADSYFGTRANTVPFEQWPSQGPFDYASTLTNDLGGWQYQLDQYYAGIVQQHQNLVNPQAPWMNTASGTTTVSSDPRVARNGGSLPNYQPQPVSPALAGQVGNTLPNAQQQQRAVGLGGQASSIPRLGAPVNRSLPTPH